MTSGTLVLAQIKAETTQTDLMCIFHSYILFKQMNILLLSYFIEMNVKVMLVTIWV